MGFFSTISQKMRKLVLTTTAVYWQRTFEIAVLGEKQFLEHTEIMHVAHLRLLCFTGLLLVVTA